MRDEDIDKCIAYKLETYKKIENGATSGIFRSYVDKSNCFSRE
jgi:hypothetical protein